MLYWEGDLSNIMAASAAGIEPGRLRIRTTTSGEELDGDAIAWNSHFPSRGSADVFGASYVR